MTVTETGYGRRSPLEDYRIQNRGGKGIMNYRVKSYGDVAAVKVVDEDDDAIMITDDGVVIRIRVNQISVISRPGKGVRVMRVEDGRKVVTLARAPHEDEITDEELPENETAAGAGDVQENAPLNAEEPGEAVETVETEPEDE